MIAETYEQNPLAVELPIRMMCQTILSEMGDGPQRAASHQDLWKKAGLAGLMGVGLPESFGGKGGGMVYVSVAARIITEMLRDTGFSLSWIVHVLLSRLIDRFGTETQKNTWLPSLIKGEKTISIAISEPEKGAHPKYLKTKADRLRGRFILTGQKSFITNGPQADLFVVIAVTKEAEGKKFFSAFIIPKETPGLRLTQAPDMPFFKTVPHGRIELSAVHVPVKNLLGKIDKAYETIVLPFSEMETALMTGLASGGFWALKWLLMKELARHTSEPRSDELYRALSELEASLHMTKIISERLAMKLLVPDILMESVFLLIFFQDLGKRVKSQFERIMELTGVQPGALFRDILADLHFSGELLEKSLQKKQKNLGQYMFEIADVTLNKK